MSRFLLIGLSCGWGTFKRTADFLIAGPARFVKLPGSVQIFRVVAFMDADGLWVSIGEKKG
jgi:hypothetical protein